MDGFSEEMGFKPVIGLNVYDMILIKHVIEKLLRGGGVTGKELSYVAGLRAKAMTAAQTACGFDIEQIGNTPTETATRGE